MILYWFSFSDDGKQAYNSSSLALYNSNGEERERERERDSLPSLRGESNSNSTSNAAPTPLTHPSTVTPIFVTQQGKKERRKKYVVENEVVMKS